MKQIFSFVKSFQSSFLDFLKGNYEKTGIIYPTHQVLVQCTMLKSTRTIF